MGDVMGDGHDIIMGDGHDIMRFSGGAPALPVAASRTPAAPSL